MDAEMDEYDDLDPSVIMEQLQPAVPQPVARAPPRRKKMPGQTRGTKHGKTARRRRKRKEKQRREAAAVAATGAAAAAAMREENVRVRLNELGNLLRSQRKFTAYQVERLYLIRKILKHLRDNPQASVHSVRRTLSLHWRVGKSARLFLATGKVPKSNSGGTRKGRSFLDYASVEDACRLFVLDKWAERANRALKEKKRERVVS